MPIGHKKNLYGGNGCSGLIGGRGKVSCLLSSEVTRLVVDMTSAATLE